MTITPDDLLSSDTIKVTGAVTDTDGSYVYLYVGRDDDNSPTAFASEYSISGNDSYSFEFSTTSYPTPNCYVFTTYIGTSALSSGTLLRAIIFDDNSVYENLVQTTQSLSYNGGQCPETATDNPPSSSEGDDNSGGCGDCMPPTIGVDSKGQRFVNDGVILNGIPTEVNYFYTEMPMQYTIINKTNHLDLKIYENSGSSYIEMVQLALGVKEIGSSINDSQAIIEIDVQPFMNDVDNPVLAGVNIVDPEDILSAVGVELSLGSCGDEDIECLLVGIDWKYRESPKYPVLAINTWDFYKNTMNDYFNEGLTVIVDEVPIVEPEPYKYVCNDTPLDEIVGPVTRNNCHFRALTDIWGSNE